MKTKFSLKSRLYSFKHAFAGLRIVIKDEHNARVHFVATGFAILLGFALELEKMEWIALLICIALVWITELLNTAIENACDLISLDYNPLIKKVKDVSAAAVFVASCLALITGIILFLPDLLQLIV